VPRLLLARHGATEYNSNFRFCGHADVPLNELGREQAERLVLRLAEERIDAAYSSDLTRAADTAARICKGRGIDPQRRPELREMGFGECDGLTFGEIAGRYPSLAAQLEDAGSDVSFPGGESLGSMAERAGGFLETLLGHGQHESVLVVSHGGPLRVLLCRLLGIGLEHWWQFRLDTGSLTAAVAYPRGAIITLMNDTSHLGLNRREHE
jgi:alpha-ribazole phosphatase